MEEKKWNEENRHKISSFDLVSSGGSRTKRNILLLCRRDVESYAG